jgi:hypothetical protein
LLLSLFGYEFVVSPVIAETEHACFEQLDNPESIYRACADMKLLSQEVLRVILLETFALHNSGGVDAPPSLPN